MYIKIPDTFPYTDLHKICEVVNHDWEKGKSSWRCTRCGKKRRRRNRSGGR